MMNITEQDPHKKVLFSTELVVMTWDSLLARTQQTFDDIWRNSKFAAALAYLHHLQI